LQTGIDCAVDFAESSPAQWRDNLIRTKFGA
jgi:hypothetical protein